MTLKSKEAPVDQRLIKALGHPVRMRVLDILNDRVASPSELAKELGEPLGNVAYHVKILEEAEAIELVRTAPVRGALEHFYRATTDVDATWLDLDDEAYEEVAALLETLVERARKLQAEAAPRLAGRPSSERHATALMIMQIHRGPADTESNADAPAGG
jgi:DNA-binding transcriptional ArsR family regulator